ncbi:hypothetical protein Tco_0757315 [Tanacetum coccineum]
MLLAAKDEAGVNLDAEENDFMLMNAYGDDQLEELNASVHASQIDLINGLLSKGDHEHKNHEKFKTIKHTSADDQIDSDIIFNDPYVEDDIEDANQRKMNNELKKKNALIQRELKTCKERVKDFGNKPVQFINYKSGYENLQYQISVEKQTIEKLKKEKDDIRDKFLKARDEYLNFKNETESFKKAFKVRGDKYHDDIVTLKEKLKFHERVIFKMSHSLQTIHMLGTKPNSFYNLNMKTGLGYQNPKRLKKAMKAQPKIYNGKNLKYVELKVRKLLRTRKKVD